MATFLFDQIVFGPVQSRRLGVSLGINLLPVNGKICSFDCIYCECGLNEDGKVEKPHIPTRTEVFQALESKLQAMQNDGRLPDVITYAGNGEPTLHPDFSAIINDSIQLRNTYAPNSGITVLSNSMHLNKPEVVEALKRVDKSVLKLDSAIQETFNIINRPQRPVNVEEVIEWLEHFNGTFILQTLFCKGTVNGKFFDNTSDPEVYEWLEAVKKVKPAAVMLYTFSRDTPLDTLEKCSNERLKAIAQMVEDAGFKTELTLS